MRPRFQADENLNVKIIAGVLRREPSLDFRTAKAADTLGLKDREALAAAARDGRVLVFHDRETMPARFADFIAQSISAGLLIVSQNVEIGETIEQILLVWAASEAHKWSNRIGYLPFYICAAPFGATSPRLAADMGILSDRTKFLSASLSSPFGGGRNLFLLA
jgi:hypothetical protein